MAARHDEHGGRQRQLAVCQRRATRCARRDDAPARPGCRAPTRTPSRTRRRRAASRRGRAPASPPRRRDPPSTTPALASAASTTPQMSRTCCREASSGTTPPHSRWIAVCDATMFERIAQGRSRIAGLGEDSRGGLVARRLDREQIHGGGLDPRASAIRCTARSKMPRLRDDAGDVAMRRHVERKIADARTLRRQAATSRCASPRAHRALRSEYGSPSGVARSIVEIGAAT